MLNRQTGIAFWADPNYCIVVSAFGAVLLITCGMPLLSTSSMRSLLIGLVIGLPAMIWHKRLKRMHIEDYARAAIDADYAKSQYWSFVAYNLPVGLSALVIWLVHLTLGLTLGSGVFVLMLLFFLTYPEDRDIANMARARLGQP